MTARSDSGTAAEVVTEPHWLNLANAFTMLRALLVPVIAVFVFADGAPLRAP